MDILNNAIEKGLTGTDLENVAALVERQRALDAENAFIAAMVQFKKALPDIYRNATGDTLVDGKPVEWDYATLDRICERLVPALSELGIVHNYRTDQSTDGMIQVTAVLTHLYGHRWEASLKAPPDTTNEKTPTQAIQSTITSLERYTLLAVCGVAVKQQRDAMYLDDQKSIPDALLDVAIAAADQGHAVFGPYWKALSDADRKTLGPILAMLERRADGADGVN